MSGSSESEDESLNIFNEEVIIVEQVNPFERFKYMMKTGSEEIKKTLPHAANVSYGPSLSQKLDMFGLDTLPPDSPIWVYVHGGRWQLFDKDMSCHMVRPLLESGIRPVVADFDIIPTVNLEEIVHQIKDLVLYVLTYALKNHVKSVWVCGHSSGGHLTATLLDYSWLRQLDIELLKIFKGVVLISGVYDLTTLVGTQKNNGIGLDNARAIAVSPLHVSLSPVVTESFKILMAVGLADDPYFIQEARKYYQFLSDAGANVELLELPDLDHFEINLGLTSPDFIITIKTIQLILSSNN